MKSESETSGLLGARSDTSFLKSCSKRPDPDPRSTSPQIKYKKSRPNVNPDPSFDPVVRHIDLGDLLFTSYRNFLITNNGRKVWARDLIVKTVVLFIVPLNNPRCMEPGDTLDMIDAYHQLLPLGGTEFVFMPVLDPYLPGGDFKDRFNYLFSVIPFPTVPYLDILVSSHLAFKTFSRISTGHNVAYWAIISPPGKLVAWRENRLYFLFKLFIGAELYPLSPSRIYTLFRDFEHGDVYDNDYGTPSFNRHESRKRLIRKWDKLLAHRTRDFLLSSNGHRVPISSLKGKLIGLYVCENIPCPPKMEVIKEAYRHAKLCGYDFEIVQINFHFEIINACHTESADFSKEQHYKNINWLKLPFKDPSCRKLQRILECRHNSNYSDWAGDCLVIIDTRMRGDEVIYELCGASIIHWYGIEGYPFTRRFLIDRECRRQKREIKLQLLFPSGLCQFTKRHVGGDGVDLVKDSQLRGKRVIVLVFNFFYKDSPLITTLKSRYLEQTKEDKFEIVYVSMDDCESEYIQNMPWLVYPYSQHFGEWCSWVISRPIVDVGAAAFDIDGQLISKGCVSAGSPKLKDQFPFFSDLRSAVEQEVKSICGLYNNDFGEPSP